MKIIIYVCLTLCLLSCVEINEEKDNDEMNLPGMPGNKKVGWSASGKLVTGNRLRQVTLQADFPRVEAYILQFNKINNPKSNLPIRAEALITWSVEGNSVSRKISIANGVALVGAAQAVRVVINDVTQSLLDAPLVVPNGVEYEVSVQTTPGVRGNTALPPVLVPIEGLLRFLGPVAPLVLNVPVPEDAGVNSVKVLARRVGFAVAPLPENALIITQLELATGLVGYEYGFQDDFEPIVPGTDTIQVELNLAAFIIPPVFPILVTVIFGIEG